MNHIPIDSRSASRRRHERVLVRYGVILELSQGRRLVGTTRNLSLGGLLFEPEGEVGAVEENSTGRIRFVSLNDAQEYPCRVAHCGSSGIGLTILDKAAAFGAALTATLMQNIQLQIGAEWEARDQIRLRLLSGGTGTDQQRLGGDHGRLVKVGSGSLEFRYPDSVGWQFRIGDVVRLELQPFRAPSFVVEGKVRMVLSGHQRGSPAVAEHLCHVLLPASMSPGTHPALRELVRIQHAKRLNQMMTVRATTIALQSGADLPPRSRSEVRQDLKRFFGFKG